MRNHPYTHLSQPVQANGLRAYKGDVSVSDPKQRRPANEVSNWCTGDALKLWSIADNKYVPGLAIDEPGRPPLKSLPTRYS